MHEIAAVVWQRPPASCNSRPRAPDVGKKLHPQHVLLLDLCSRIWAERDWQAYCQHGSHDLTAATRHLNAGTPAAAQAPHGLLCRRLMWFVWVWLVSQGKTITLDVEASDTIAPLHESAASSLGIIRPYVAHHHGHCTMHTLKLWLGYICFAFRWRHPYMWLKQRS